MNKKLRIFISGPMEGKENYLNDFLQATQEIRSAGHIPVNPAALPAVYPDADREEYLKFDLALLAECDAVYFLPGWRESCGANREYGYALGLDKIILKEGDTLYAYMDPDAPVVPAGEENAEKRRIEGMNEKAIGRNIEKKLNEAGITQRELAELAGITEVTISRYINGLRIPKAPALMAIARALNCDIESLLQGVEYDDTKEAPELTISDFMRDVWETNEAKGFHINTTPVEYLALIHSEVSETLEEFRAGHYAEENYYRESDGKPEGVPMELADVVIRCFDMAYVFGIDLEAAIKEKHAFDKARPYLHGKKF